jgi:hypothetical protein
MVCWYFFLVSACYSLMAARPLMARQVVDPSTNFHVTLLGGIPTHGLDRLLCLFFVDSQELVLGYDINFNAAFLVGLLDRLHHHHIRGNLAHNQRTHPFFDQAEGCASAGLSDGSPGKGHNIIEGFRRSQVRGKTRSRYLVLSAPDTRDTKPKQIIAIIKAILVFTKPPP